MSGSWMFARPPLTRVTESGLVTTQESFEFDDIIYATGYDAMTGALNAIDIRGRNDASLRKKWAAGPVTYLGLAVAGFPNLFVIAGPGSPSVLSNMMVSIEQHVDWVAAAIDALRSKGITTIEAEADAEQEWTRHVDEVGNMTLYPKVDSWYVGSNVPGKPPNTGNGAGARVRAGVEVGHSEAVTGAESCCAAGKFAVTIDSCRRSDDTCRVGRARSFHREFDHRRVSGGGCEVSHRSVSKVTAWRGVRLVDR
ncbi:hypothetical protein ACGF5S_31710 [Nocardia nova]|uniref:hypothetical protein n=1 Tax=Nocardia nova TaxID=37330 RepID=UPI00371AB6B8